MGAPEPKEDISAIVPQIETDGGEAGLSCVKWILLYRCVGYAKQRCYAVPRASRRPSFGA